MKKIISILCIVAMLTVMLPSWAGAPDFELTVEEAEAYPGAEVTVDIVLSGNTTTAIPDGICGMILYVDYGSDLTLTGATKGTALPGLTFTPAGTITNPFKLVWDGQDGDKNSNGVACTLTFTAPEDLGTYDVKISYGDGDINDGQMEDLVADITNGSVTVVEKPKKPITGLSLADKTVTYDGKNYNLAVSGTLPEGATVSYTVDGAEFTGTKKAGTYAVKATVSAPDYQNWTAEKTLTINKKNLTVTGFGAENKTYDATTRATMKSATLSGAVTGDDVKLNAPEEGTFASANAGTGIAVTFDALTLTGEDKDNYTLTQPTGVKANITKAAITVTADNKSMRKDTAVPALTYTVTAGELFAGDTLTGALACTANGKTVGTFDITQGTLSAGSNYNMTFKKGTLTVNDKTPQNISVPTISDDKTYGDEPFSVKATADPVSELENFTYASNDASVATVSTDGTVTIVGAGKVTITVRESGNDEYAAFEKAQTITVAKLPLTVQADDIAVIQNKPFELTYTVVSGALINGDTLAGDLDCKADGKKLGEFPITQGTLTAGKNYDLTFIGGTLTVTDKTPQTITYGGAPLFLTYGQSEALATPVASSGLTNFTYSSANEAVCTVDATGMVTTVGAGETTITITQPGDATYAKATFTLPVTVTKQTVKLKNVVIGDKTYETEPAGISLDLDWDLIPIATVATYEDYQDIQFLFNLKGDDANKYELDCSEICAASYEVTPVFAIPDRTYVEEAPEDGNYFISGKITVKAAPRSGYKFVGWQEAGATDYISTDETYTFNLTDDTTLTPVYKKKSSGGGGSVSNYTVAFDTNGGSEVASIKVARNTKIADIPQPTKKGYVFAGWYKDADLTKKFEDDDIVTSAMTLYAAWEEGEEVGDDNATKELVLTIGSKNASVFGEETKNDVAPIIRNDRTMLPARFVAEALGAKVGWNEEFQRVTITKGDVTIIITIGAKTAIVNGEEVKLDAPAFIENDRTYTPIRFISENLGATVAWDEDTQKVTITLK